MDSAVLIALYSRRDQVEYREKAQSYVTRFDNEANRIVLPWPVMYESINTRIASYRPGMEMFARHLKKFRQTGQLIEVDDSPYRMHALEECMVEPTKTHGYRSMSLVDRVLRLMLSDPSHRFSGLLTFNERDFVDICRKRNIEIFGRT